VSVFLVGHGRDVPSWQGLGFVSLRHSKSLGRFAARGLGFFAQGRGQLGIVEDWFFLIILRRGTREDTTESYMHRTSSKRVKKNGMWTLVDGGVAEARRAQLPPSLSSQEGSGRKTFR
jgi:hypothetical protein